MKAKERKQETWWVLRAQSGDRKALNALLQHIQDPLFGYLFKLVGERDLARDILQEVFILIYKKLAQLQEPTLFRPWAYRIASRTAFKRLKREKRWREQLRDETLFDTRTVQAFENELTPESKEQLDRLIVTHVSPASRAVLLLHYFHSMTLVEVANVLGIPLGTVKSRLAYGLHRLRCVMAKERSSGCQLEFDESKED